jgi:hypothetical protein
MFAFVISCLYKSAYSDGCTQYALSSSIKLPTGCSSCRCVWKMVTEQRYSPQKIHYCFTKSFNWTKDETSRTCILYTYNKLVLSFNSQSVLYKHVCFTFNYNKINVTFLLLF